MASYGSCTGVLGEYAIQVDGPMAGELSLVMDDTPRLVDTVHTLAVDGAGQLME